MSSSKNVVISGVLATVLAVALIAAAVLSGVATTGKVGTRIVPVTTTVYPSSSSSGQGPQSSTTAAQQGAGAGTMAVLLTDPPTVPDGVSNVDIDYSNLAIHVSGAGNQSGWNSLGTSGQVDLMSIINVTQTIALAKVSTGTFDAIAFNVTSATVTYQGTNYTADLVYQEHILVAKIPGGISVNDGGTSATVIDLTPTVLLLGTPANPSFAFIPSARAYALPAQSVSVHALQTVGDRENIENANWWKSIETNSQFEITNLKLTSNLLSITVSNTGSSSVVFRMAAITSTISLSGGMKPSIAQMASISAFFVVEPNATLAPITQYGRMEIAGMLASGGYLLPPHATVTLTYNGNIMIGLLQPVSNPRESGAGASSSAKTSQQQQINAGQRYVVTLFASDGDFAQILVVAS